MPFAIEILLILEVKLAVSLIAITSTNPMFWSLKMRLSVLVDVVAIRPGWNG